MRIYALMNGTTLTGLTADEAVATAWEARKNDGWEMSGDYGPSHKAVPWNTADDLASALESLAIQQAEEAASLVLEDQRRQRDKADRLSPLARAAFDRTLRA